MRISSIYNIRKTLSGTSECPRLNVFRSNNGIFVQVIDDTTGKSFFLSLFSILGFLSCTFFVSSFLFSVCMMTSLEFQSVFTSSFCELAGVKDVISKSLGSNTKINVAKATLEALKSERTPAKIAALRGKKVDEELFYHP